MANEVSILKDKNFAAETFGHPGKMMELNTIMRNGTGKAYLVENSDGYAYRNIVSIKLNNTGGGAVDCILYIGGPACLAGYTDLYDLPAGAQDNGVITDQYGIGVKFTQGLGLLLNNGAYIHDFQVVANTDNSLQLQEDIVTRQYFPNGDTMPIRYPALSTFEMTDQRKNMMKDKKLTFLIDGYNGVEYNIIIGFQGTVLFVIRALDLSSLMNVLEA